MSGPGRQIERGALVPVDPPSIERALAALWKPASRDEGGEGAVVRACLGTIVVHAATTAAQRRAHAILDQIFTSFPNRTILVTTGVDGAGASPPGPERNGGGLRARITTICSTASGRGAPVCCEEIILAAPPGHSRLAAGAVTPLLVSDVPVILWWTGPIDGAILERLAPLADLCIVDTSPPAGDGPDLGEVEHLLASEAITSLADLEWHRLARWRRGVASIFEDATARALARSIDRIEIEIAASPEGSSGAWPPPPAALLAGWLGVRLRWTPAQAAAGGTEVVCRAGKRIAALVLRRRAASGTDAAGSAAGRDGGIRSVRFTSAADGELTSIGLTAPEGAGGSARLDVHTRRECRLPCAIPFASPPDAEILGGLLAGAGDASGYREAAALATRITGLCAAVSETSRGGSNGSGGGAPPHEGDGDG